MRCFQGFDIRSYYLSGYSESGRQQNLKHVKTNNEKRSSVKIFNISLMRMLQKKVSVKILRDGDKRYV